MAREVGYFFRPKVTGNVVSLAYRIRRFNGPMSAYMAMVNAVQRDSKWAFNNSNSGLITNRSPPNLNLAVFFRDSLGTSGRLKWEFVLPSERQLFVDGLKVVAKVLASEGLIDPAEVDAAKLFRAIVRDREHLPMINIGGKLYRMQLSEEKVSPFRVEDEFKEQISTELEINRQHHAAVLEEEIRKLRAENTRPYDLSLQDIVDGWLTGVGSDGAILAKRFTYSPIYAASGTQVRRIKPEVKKAMTRSVMLVYQSHRSNIRILNEDGDAFSFPHSHSSTGIMCTGSINVHSGLLLEEAKELIDSIIKMLDTININSMLQFYYAGYDIGYDFFTKECIDPNQTTLETTSEGEDESVVINCDEGAVL